MPERDCIRCTRQAEWGCYAKRLYPDKTGPEAWDRPAWLPIDLDGEETYACPRQPIREDPDYWSEIFRYYSLWKKGYLPYGSEPDNQTPKAMAVLQLLDSYVSECQKEKSDQDQRQTAQSKLRS